MVTRIAVVDTPSIIQNGIAPYLLFFDKVAVPDLDYSNRLLQAIQARFYMNSMRPGDITNRRIFDNLTSKIKYYYKDSDEESRKGKKLEECLEDFETLFDKGLLYDPNFYGEHTRFIKNYDELFYRNISKYLDGFYEFTPPLDWLFYRSDDALKKFIQLRQKGETEVLLFGENIKQLQATEIPESFDKSDAMCFVFQKIPFPSSKVPIQELLDFKRDSEVSTELMRFRNWIRKSAKSLDNCAELEDEYEDIYHRYKKSVTRLHNEYNMNTLQIIFSVAAEFADNLGRLKFGSAIKSIFNYKLTKIEFERKFEELREHEFEYVRKLEQSFN